MKKLLFLFCVCLVLGCNLDTPEETDNAEIDKDDDGVVAELDCDDDDASLLAIAEDADCDGVLTAVDCDDDDKDTLSNENDMDCDGIPNEEDDDADGDGTLAEDDCDDLDAALNAETDPDGDCVAADEDNCAERNNPEQENVDGDTMGDACDNCPNITNEGQEDGDGDEAGDVCDNCLTDANKYQNNNDGDDLGDVCDDDWDNDGLNNDSDNCPWVENDTQEDFDNDGIGDLCDTDYDGDGFIVNADCDDQDSTLLARADDLDCDGILNDADTDADGDGILTDDDCDDRNLRFAEKANDTDCDGYTDAEENHKGTDPNDATSLIYKGLWPYNMDKLSITDPGWGGTAIDGSGLPHFIAMDHHEEMVDLYDFAKRGKKIILDTGTPWCKPCKALSAYLSSGDESELNWDKEWDEPSFEKKYAWWKDDYRDLYKMVRDGEIYWITIVFSQSNPIDIGYIQDWDEAYPNSQIPVVFDETNQLIDHIGVTCYPTLNILNEDLEFLDATPCGPHRALRLLFP